ncbi:MAG: endonuclease [Bacteroidetes bacterium]|nr:MAG: endonuclease [Bacteroidota bacterium]
MFKIISQGLIVLFAFAYSNAFANQAAPTIKILSWNLLDFGKTKSDSEIDFIAQTVKDYDIVLIQEVVAKDPGGAQAVGRLGEALNKKGSKWEYRISNPTSGDNSYKKERYAFLWKPSKVSLVGRPWLEQQYTIEMDREPFYATFEANDKRFTLVNFHAITQSMQPETEVKYFKFLPGAYPSLNLIFCGDFNLPQSHTVFNPIKAMGYKPIFTNQKTSLRQSCIANDCLASEFDNIFYNIAKVLPISSGVVHFYKSFSSIQEARKISDHIPVFFVFQLK